VVDLWGFGETPGAAIPTARLRQREDHWSQDLLAADGVALTAGARGPVPVYESIYESPRYMRVIYLILVSNISMRVS
jgi:hypothetical protein